MSEHLTSWLGAALSSTLSSTRPNDFVRNSSAIDQPARAAPPTSSWPSLEVVPGDRLGDLALGMTVPTITRWLQAVQRPLQLDIEYTAPSTESLDLCLTLRRGAPSCPFLKLHFGGRRQSLGLIEILDLGAIELTYGGRSLVTLPAFSDGVPSCTPPLTMQRLFDVLGRQGTFADDSGFTYWQQGIAAWACSGSSGSADTSAVWTPVERLLVYRPVPPGPQDLIRNRRLPRESGADRWPGGVPSPDVFIQLGGSISGALFTVMPEDVRLQCGMQVQEVLASIGSPDEEYDGFPQGSQHELLAAAQKLDVYVHNYFRRGFDVVYNACSHSVAGFVMHTNFAADQDFGLYERCCFCICVDAAAPDAAQARERKLESELAEAVDTPHASLTPWSSHEAVVALLGPPLMERERQQQPPLALAALVASSKEDPLGQKDVLCWANYGIVVECMAGAKETGCRCVTTVTVLPLCRESE